MDTENVIAMDSATLLRWFGMIVLILASLIFIIQWLTPKLRTLFYNNTPSESDDTEHKEANPSQDEIRIVLVGKSGVGKSELGNSLLGDAVFAVAASMSSVTSSCSSKQQYIDYIKSTLTIIDTPGLFDTKISNEDQTKAIVECIQLTNPGPHVFIVVVNRASRFTAENQETVDYIEKIFGVKSCKFMIVVFTNKQHSDKPIDDTWVRHADQEPLKSLLEKCNYRYSSIDNKGEKQQEDVKSILDLITKTIKDNNNHFYSGEMYGEAAVLYMKYLAEKKEKEEKMEILEKEKEEIRERLEKEKEEKEELKIKCEKLEKINKNQEEKRERMERLEKANEQLVKENEQLKLNRIKEKEEDIKNLPWNSYDVKLIPKGYFKDSSHIGIPSDALIKESLQSKYTDGIQLKSYVFNTKDIKIKKPQRGRGRMPDEEYYIIQSNYIMLLDNIQPDVLCQALFEKGVFDDDDLEQIKKEETNGRKAVTEKLLELLLRCGHEAFGKFMTCLQQTGHDEIFKQLQSAFVGTTKAETKQEEKSSSIWQKFRYNKNKKTEEKKKKEEEKAEKKKKENQKEEEKRKADKDNEVKYDVGYDREFISPLHEESLNCEDMEKYKIVVAKYIQNINTTDWLGSTPLLKACISKYHPIEKLILLQKSGADINKTNNNNNNNVLHLACSFGSLNTVKYLIEELQFNIKTPGFTGRTPVLQSSYSEISPVEKISYLISKGVNVKTVDNNNNNVLHLACDLGSLNTVKYLIEELQFNIETPGFNNQTPVLQSSYSKISPVEKMTYLISKGVNVKTVDNNNNNVLILACMWGILETVIFLVESGFNINPSDGKKPLLSCSQSEIQPVAKIKYLISVGAKLTQEDKQFYISRAKFTETKEFLETL